MSPWKTCLNTSTIKTTPLLDKIRVTATAGFDAIELWINDIYEYMWNHEDHPLQQKVDDIWAFVASKLIRMQEISLAQVTTH